MDEEKATMKEDDSPAASVGNVRKRKNSEEVNINEISRSAAEADFTLNDSENPYTEKTTEVPNSECSCDSDEREMMREAEMERNLLDKITKQFGKQFLESTNEGIYAHDLNLDLFMCLTLCGKQIPQFTIQMMTLPKICLECDKLTLPDCSRSMDSLIKFIQCTDAPELIVRKISFIFREPCRWPNFANLAIAPLQTMKMKQKEVVYDIRSSLNFMELRAKLTLVPNYYEMQLEECRLEMA